MMMIFLKQEHYFVINNKTIYLTTTEKAVTKCIAQCKIIIIYKASFNNPFNEIKSNAMNDEPTKMVINNTLMMYLARKL